MGLLGAYIQRGEIVFEKIFAKFVKNLPFLYEPVFFNNIEMLYKTFEEGYSRRIRPIIIGEKAADKERQRLIDELLAEEAKGEGKRSQKRDSKRKQKKTASGCSTKHACHSHAQNCHSRVGGNPVLVDLGPRLREGEDDKAVSVFEAPDFRNFLQ